MATETPASESLQSHIIDIHAVPAIIEWTVDGQHRCLGTSFSSTPASLDIHFDASARTLSFRPRVVLFRRHSDNPIPVYLIIGPKELQSIARDEPQPAVQGPKNNTIRLLFQLQSPATLVVPPDPMRLNNSAQAATFRLVRSVARQTSFSIHLQADVLSQAELTTLCDANYQSCQPSSRHTDLKTLYGGRGGKTIEPAVVQDASAESPPSYNEIGAPPPMAPVSYGSDTASSSKKRRRSSSSSRDRGPDLSLIEALCRKMICESHEALRSELSGMEARVIERVDQRLDNRVRILIETQQAQIERLRGQIQELEDVVQITNQATQGVVKSFEAKTAEFEAELCDLDGRCQGECNTLDDRIQEVSDDIDRRVDMEVEDRVLGIKTDLEEFVKDELKNTEDAIKERLATASWSLQFDE